MHQLPLSLLASLPGFRYSTLRQGGQQLSLDESGACLRTDSRACRPGDLFVALRGLKTDAHRLVPSLLEAGVTCVVSRDWFLAQPEDLRDRAGMLVVEDTRDWLPRAVCRLAGLDRAELRVHGITGTNGKSSTAWILHQLLLGLDSRAGLVGTLGARLGSSELRDTGLTTPDPLWLGRFGAELVAAGGSQLAMEVSSHAIAQQREAVFSYQSAVFLNLSPEHLDYHGDMESYYRMKAGFMRRPECELRLVCLESAWGRRMAEELAFLPHETFGRSPEADWRITEEQALPQGQRFILEHGGERHEVELPLPGSYNAENATAALVCALRAGRPMNGLLAELRQVEAVPGRLEAVMLPGGPRVLIDYAHSPDGYQRALQAVRESVGAGRLHVLFGCGGDRDREKRPVMYAIASAQADQLWLCLDNPRHEDPEQIFADMLSHGTSDTPQQRIDDRAEAIAAALAACDSRDTLLLLGKGHERYQLIAGRTLPFDERSILREAWSRLEAARG